MKTGRWIAIRLLLAVSLGACSGPDRLDERALLRELQRRVPPTSTVDAAVGTELRAAQLAAALHPTVRAAQAQVPVAAAAAQVSSLLREPEIRLGTEVASDPLANDRTVAALQMNLPNPLMLSASVAAAEAQLPVAQAQVAVQAWLAKIAARRAWGQLVSARERTAWHDAWVNLLKRKQDWAQTALASGHGEPLVARQAEAMLTQAQQQWAEARQAEQVALAVLREATASRTTDESWSLATGPLPCHPPVGATATDSDSALLHHPELQVAAAQYAQAAAAVGIEVGKAIPWLQFVQVGTETVIPASPSANQTAAPNQQSLRLATAIEVPVFQWSGARLQQARALRDRERMRYEAVALRLLAARETAVVRWQAAHATAQRLERDVLPALQKAHQVAQEAVAARRFAANIALDAEDKVLLARRQWLEARSTCHEAQLQAEAVGTAPSGQ